MKKRTKEILAAAVMTAMLLGFFGAVYSVYYSNSTDFNLNFFQKEMPAVGMTGNAVLDINSFFTFSDNIKVLSGDYDGDGSADLALWNPNDGKWKIFSFAKNQVLYNEISWGVPIMTPVSGDYDGNGKDDLALFDSVAGKWWILGVDNQNIAYGTSWGSFGMIPVSGDYDGDGRYDLALWNPSDGKWYIKSLNGETLVWAVQWGTKDMIPVSGDYDGDGRYDLALWNPADGKWYIRDLTGTKVIAWAVQWGTKDMIPVSGDYDGDGKSDLALFNSADGKWYVHSIAKNENILYGISQGGSSSTLKIMTYNTKFGTYSNQPKLALMAQMIKKYNIDVVALQEMENQPPKYPALGMLLDELNKIGYGMGSSYLPYSDDFRKQFSGLNFGLAVLSRYPISEMTRPSFNQGQSLKINFNSNILRFVNMHVSPNPDDFSASADQINMVSYSNSFAEPTFLLGDMNCPQNFDPNVCYVKSRITDYFKDSCISVNDPSCKCTVPATDESGKLIYGYDQLGCYGNIDHIFYKIPVGEKNKWALKKTFVINSANDVLFVSDHYPVVSEFLYGEPYLPLSGDFDGDRKNDMFLYNPSTNKIDINYSASLTQNPILPACIEGDWAKTDGACQSNNLLTRIWAKVGNCNETIGIKKPSSESISCVYSPTTPPCTEANWNFRLTPSICPPSGQQNKTWTKVGSCSGGINHPASENIPCIYSSSAKTCTNYVYSDWSECLASGVQTRSLIFSSPENCTLGNILTSQICNYTGILTISSSQSSETEQELEQVFGNGGTIKSQPMKEEPGFFKKAWCRIIHPINDWNYQECIWN